MIGRREFMAGLAGTAAWPLVARAPHGGGDHNYIVSSLQAQRETF